MPDILANGNTHLNTRHIHHAGALSLGKISLLVKHLVVWQPLLEVLTNNGATVNDSRRVE